jgi:glycine cleavage system H protein
LLYTGEHEWVRQLPGGKVRIGITDHAQGALGDIVFLTLPALGDALAAGEPCGEVESTKSVSELYAPVDGSVTAVNDQLDQSPELVNSEPYEAGWMFEAEVSAGFDVAKLLTAEQYRDLVN